MQKNKNTFIYADNRLKKDKDFILKVIKINIGALLHADDEL